MRRGQKLSIVLVAVMGMLGGSCLCLGDAPADATLDARAAMAKLDGLVGRWEGEATLLTGDGPPRQFRQVEDVQKKMDGNVLLVEGTGLSEGRVVFRALAVAAYDIATRTYKFHAFRDNGLSTVATAETTPTGLIWGFEDGRGGRVRYTITLEGDTWSEIGEYLREGQPARKFFEMTVRRIARPGAGG